MNSRTKIYCYKIQVDDGFAVYALAEDGRGLIYCYMRSGLYARHQLGINSTKSHKVYMTYYPNGYDLIDLIDLSSEELDKHEGLQAALKLHGGPDNEGS